MELALRTDMSSFSQSIDFNYHELKEELSTKLAKYQNLVVTADSIKSAKADRAALNKLADAIDSKRREVKKILLEPYTEFEEKCKDLICLIKEPINAIDSQIKEFDDIKKQKKYAELQVYFDENVKELSDLVSLDKILNPKWENSTSKVDKLKNVFYCCSASRTDIEGDTTQENKEVKTEKLSIKAAPLANGLVKSKSCEVTDTTVYNDWYQSVYMPTISSTPSAPSGPVSST